ncbi:MAG: hypothetical protein FWD80_07165 [Propionibacteriaceae bacterium]|nr:hypothetical protein [Propionibacteriaceae bacterium]
MSLDFTVYGRRAISLERWWSIAAANEVVFSGGESPDPSVFADDDNYLFDLLDSSEDLVCTIFVWLPDAPDWDEEVTEAGMVDELAGQLSVIYQINQMHVERRELLQDIAAAADGWLFDPQYDPGDEQYDPDACQWWPETPLLTPRPPEPAASGKRHISWYATDLFLGLVAVAAGTFLAWMSQHGVPTGVALGVGLPLVLLGFVLLLRQRENRVKPAAS